MLIGKISDLLDDIDNGRAPYLFGNAAAIVRDHRTAQEMARSMWCAAKLDPSVAHTVHRNLSFCPCRVMIAFSNSDHAYEMDFYSEKSLKRDVDMGRGRKYSTVFLCDDEAERLMQFNNLCSEIPSMDLEIFKRNNYFNKDFKAEIDVSTSMLDEFFGEYQVQVVSDAR